MKNNGIKNLSKLFSELDIAESDALIEFEQANWKHKTNFPSRINRLLEETERWSPKALFCFDNKPLILFFENPSPDKERSIHKAVWNLNETPIVIILKIDSINIYNGFAIDENTEFLKKLGNNDDKTLNDFKYFELVTGKTFEKYNNDFAHENRVDYKLLQNIEDTQKILCNECKCSRAIANALIGKVIFIRYLIDRKVTLNFKDTAKQWTNNDFCNLLRDKNQVYSFFEYLQDKDKGFNGDLFPIDKTKFDTIPQEAFDVLRKLLESEDIASGQKSLFQLYDFSVLPIEFISNVYEKFIGKENQVDAGAYYTPTFLVDYIVKETVCRYLDKTNIGSCKVLDPACGSGIFLVETLRKIIEKNFSLEKPNDREEFKTRIKRLAQENIFGIDKDESAIQVAIFSVYLTLLDYQNPAEIENFKFPNLLGSNFFVADFFDEKASYNDILHDTHFSFIIGNPPWAGGKKGLDNIGKNYIKERRKKEQSVEKEFKIGINNNELAEGFIFRVSDFCNANTQTAFIVRSSILYKLGYSNVSPFRSYWLQEFFIDKVFELAPVRHEIFNRSSDPAIAPAAIIFYRYANGKNTDKNVLEHITLKPSRFFSMFKIFSMNRSDCKEIQQNRLKQYDWLWKTLVYGSSFDFNFLKRIKETYPSIQEVIADKKKFVEGTGIQYSNDSPYDSTRLIGKDFIDSHGIEPFFIYPDKILKFDKKKVHRLRNEKKLIFKAPMLLIRKGLDLKKLIIKSAVSNQDLLFKDSLTSIAVINSQDINCLYNIQSVFTTDILCYYAINIFAFIGIEREQTQNYDKYTLPYLELNVQKEINEIERAKLELYTNEKDRLLVETKIIDDLENKINKNIECLNNKVLQKLELSDCERSLIDYAVNVSRFMFNKNLKDEQLKLFMPVEITDNILRDYAQLYISRFAQGFNKDGKRFIVEIWYTKQIIGMFFKTIDKNDFEENIVMKDKKTESEIIQFIVKLGTEQITNRLFVQKDIRGFEKKYFYIFKPNEKRLWHKAIGYLDVDEFADAILRMGRDVE